MAGRGGGGAVFGLCEQRFLTLVGLLPISLSRDKETGERKRAEGEIPLCTPCIARYTQKTLPRFLLKHARL